MLIRKTNPYPKFIIYTLILSIHRVFSDQFYDPSACNATSQFQGSNYLCIANNFQCQTYIVYRAQQNFLTLDSIASLFNSSISQLQSINNMTEFESNNLILAQEVLIPIICTCPSRFSRAIFMYNLPKSQSFDEVACGVFEGLVKMQVLMAENPGFESNHLDNVMIKVPIRCACLDDKERSDGLQYFVTYPVMEEDDPYSISRKFGVPENSIKDANKLRSDDSIFPQTTLLIPTMDFPIVNSDSDSFGHPPHSPNSVPLRKIKPDQNSIKAYIFLGMVVLLVMILISIALVLATRIAKKNQRKRFIQLSTKTTHLSNFSPDFLDGISKLKPSLTNYTLEELKIAAQDLNNSSMIGTGVYRAKIGNSHVAIEQMNTEEDAHHVINILTKINHINIVKLEGFCGGKYPFLVFEFAEMGSLKDCLTNRKMGKILIWKKRMQIAFDLAVGIHYIHYCTNPTYVHSNITSKNVLISEDFRAKISGFGFAKALIPIEESYEINKGKVSFKLDVFGFGVILLKLLSAKEVILEGNLMKECLKFLDEDCENCLEKLKEFMDFELGSDYPICDALCLALLAKACVDDDPIHRPNMNDVLKALSRII